MAAYIQKNKDDVQDTRREIRRIKILDIEATRNALNMAHRAFAVGSSTLRALKEQDDRLHRVEHNLQDAADTKKDTSRKLNKLKQAKRMMKIANPFARSNQGREEQDNIRAAKWHTWKETHFHAFTNVPLRRGATRQDVLNRTKYQFEPDSDDEAIEDVIDSNIDKLLAAVHRVKSVAMAQGTELDQ